MMPLLLPIAANTMGPSESTPTYPPVTKPVCSAAQSCLTLCNSVGCSPRGSPVMGFSRQEYWIGWPFSSPVDLPNPGIEPASLVSPALAGRFFTTGTTWEAPHMYLLSPFNQNFQSAHKITCCFFFSFNILMYSLCPEHSLIILCLFPSYLIFKDLSFKSNAEFWLHIHILLLNFWHNQTPQIYLAFLKDMLNLEKHTTEPYCFYFL